MSQRLRFLLCAFPALSSIPLATDGKSPAAGATSPAPETANERGTPALFSWGDFNGDGRLDLAAVNGEGQLQVLLNTGDGRFEDATERIGLFDIGDAAVAAWADYDGDGRLDLFVGSRAGISRLFHNEPGEVFIDMTARSGLPIQGAVESAEWFDYDGDGRLDLSVVRAGTSELYRGLARGAFERVELPLAASSRTTPGQQGPVDTRSGAPRGKTSPGLSEPATERAGSYTRRSAPTRSGAIASTGVTVTPIPGGPHGPAAASSCFTSITDQALPSNCIDASSTPTLGLIYPISANLFVATPSGNVGINTILPTHRLDVAGDAQITNKLTLNPAPSSGDQSLDVNTGSIYKGGLLFIHTKGGTLNTAIGRLALANAAGGSANTASGDQALFTNTLGNRNTAMGAGALFNNTVGTNNTATGAYALRYNVSGTGNTATGMQALRYNTSGQSNTASGSYALFLNSSGDSNTASGAFALFSNSTGFDNTANGFQALNSNTTGSINTATGYLALKANTTGVWNTAVGGAALSANTTGDFNTAIGVKALDANTTGRNNTASGLNALEFNTTGNDNTASGVYALRSNTTGSNNTASGYLALHSNSTGTLNVANGSRALQSNTTAPRNTASGYRALYANTTGSANTAIGYGTLVSNTTGHRNIALGNNAGANLTTNDDNIAIGHVGFAGSSATIRIGTAGTHTRTFIAGIRAVTTANANAIPVLVDSAGQLGTVSSSRRFKKDIADMGDATRRLLELRPVVFRYKENQTLPSGEVPMEYGLIAEEVAEIFPDLVVYDEDGKPFTVKYHLLSSMLLNEMKRQAREMNEMRSRLTALETRAFPATPPAAVPAGDR